MRSGDTALMRAGGGSGADFDEKVASLQSLVSDDISLDSGALNRDYGQRCDNGAGKRNTRLKTSQILGFQRGYTLELAK